jgi:NAD(P)H-dependent nitrite reductase large subunit
VSAKQRLVVIGNGMAGARLVEDVLARGGRDRFTISVFGNEPHGNYNRILLSGVLAGSHQPRDIFINPLSWYAQQGVVLHAADRVEAIDVERKEIFSASGAVEKYDTLVIATGSSGWMPPMDGLRTESGTFKEGVFVFRTLDDCSGILKRAETSTRAVVVGGGLLGLEAAKGLLNRGLEVHVLHVMPHVMEAQLDAAAGGILRRELEQMGMHLHLKNTVTAILGDSHVTGVILRDGAVLDCDLIVVAAGIRANVELAVRAGLEVDRGIVVDDDLACRPASDVYAVGECAQHRGRVYGLVAPVWEQVDVLADRLTGRRPDARYEGSSTSTKLKVAGVELAVMGDKEPVEEDDEVVSYSEPSRGVYKKLIVRNNRIAGAIVMGDGTIVPGLIQAFRESTALADSRARLLFPIVATDAKPHAADRIPDTAQICDCNAVTKAEIVEAVLRGARTLQAVSDVTHACTGCGSCRPQVQAILEFAAQGAPPVEVMAAPPAEAAVVALPTDGSVVVTLNKIERYKKEKDGLDILEDVPRLAQSGWEAIEEGDRERLKWAGVFFRRQTPGQFMMRLRMSNGVSNGAQMRTIAEISREYGPGFADITTRQQIQLRGFGIERVPELWDRLEAVGLVSLQTGMDNIRNVAGCPAAGLTPHELFDASPIVRAFTDRFLRNKAFTNLPRKFNVAITGCTEHCTHAESQDLALVPASARIDGRDVNGFNVLVGGKMGSGGFQAARSLDVFATQEEAVDVCSQITFIFRDHGSRTARNRARLAFLIDAWGVARFRQELELRMGHSLRAAGRDARGSRHVDHLGVARQRQRGLNSVGLVVPVGRITADQLFELARIAETYGTGDIRVTASQNVIVPNVPDASLPALGREPLLAELSHNPHAAFRGLVSCTGIDYCHFALIETKALAIATAQYLERQLPGHQPFTTHWSGCPAGCGNHALADIGLLGKNIRVDGELVDAVDVFVGGKSGPNAKAGTRVLEDVPCDDLPEVLERMIPYVSKKRPGAAKASGALDGPGAAPAAAVQGLALKANT